MDWLTTTSLIPLSKVTSCLLLQVFCPVFRYVLNGSSSVTYRSMCFKLVAKKVPSRCLFRNIRRISAMPSNESRTRSANVVFYILCILHGFCVATVLCDLLEYIFAVSSKFIFENIIFIISCTGSFYLCTITSTSN